MIQRIHQYIVNHGRVSNQQLMRTFLLDASALEPILGLCLKRGKIKKCFKPTKGCQSKCIRCVPQTLEYYEPC